VSLLAPAYLALAGVVAAGVVLLHYLSRRRPRPAPLPTARFVPDVPARAPALATRPSDMVLLALRVLAVLAAGLALSRPVRAPARRFVARVVVADLSRAARSAAEVRDSARVLAGPGDTLLAVDSAARGSISGALVTAVRAASRLQGRADSLELVLVSPFAAEEFDAATDTVRALWPGRARIVRVAAAAEPAAPRLTVVGAPDDPIRAPIAMLGVRTGAEVRIVRGALTAADSTFARDAHALVHWPADPTAVWPASQPDTIGAVIAGRTVVVAPFERRATQPRLDSSAVPLVLARWADGTPASFERSFESGCIRDVAIELPAAGDLVLRRSVRDLIESLAAPCGGPRRTVPVADARLDRLRRGGALMPSRTLSGGSRRAGVASGWLIALAALLLLAELVLRPRAASS
jgi:hypothetical protein